MSSAVAASSTSSSGPAIHGLSTAWHLAKEQTRPRASSPTCLIIDKTGVGAGASGIACGVVRNNYYQPAMSELMAANVEVWEQDPQAFSYHPVGYMRTRRRATDHGPDRGARAAGPDRLSVAADRRRAERARAHEARCSPTGARRASTSACTSKRAASPTTWPRCTVSPPRPSEAGARLIDGVRVTGFETDSSGAVTTVQHRPGRHRGRAGRGRRRSVDREHLGRCWASPTSSTCTRRTGEVHRDQQMWTYWYLQEGEIGVDPKLLSLEDGSMPPVLHVDSDAPLYARRGQAGHRRALGQLLQAGPARRPGRGRAGRGRPRVRRRPLPDRLRRVGVRRHVVRLAVALHGALRGQARHLQATSARAASAASRSTASRCSTTCARTCT